MKILLDTCTFLWILLDAKELSPLARELFLEKENQIYLSVVSCWEISIKYQLKKIHLPENPKTYLPKQRTKHGIYSLELDEESACHFANIPALHRDPFDKMIVSQAIIQEMTILTPDPLIAQYPAKVIWSK